MELQDIIKTLTETHYEESFHFNIFDSNHKKTDCLDEKYISDLFTNEEWNMCITLLDRIQSQGQHDTCLKSFWEHFLVGVKYDLDIRRDFVRLNSLNVEGYLKHILVLLGFNEDVKDLQDNGEAMTKIISIAYKKAQLFGNLPYAENILDTLRCYGNWWRHNHTKTSDNDTEEARHTMIIPRLRNNQKDFDFFDEHVRMILAILLLIIKHNYQEIDNRLAPAIAPTMHAELFNELEFLDRYFNNLQTAIEKKLQAQAIKELKTEDELGYFEHSFRFSHGSQSNTDELEDEDNDTQQKLLRLSQFRKVTKYKTNIILGMPGAGKTTALFMLANQCILNYNKRDEDEKVQAPIPIIVPLRNIAISHDSQEIINAINQSVGQALIDKNDSYRSAAFKYIFSALEEGRVVLFFDGLNEIQQSDVNIITDNIISLIEKTLPDNSRIFITGRKYEYDGSVYSGEFKKVDNVGIWHLEELSFEQIDSFLSPDIRSQIINGQIVELFSSPLNLRLFLNYIRSRQMDGEDSSLEVPINRGEMLESFLADTIKEYNNNLKDKRNRIDQFHSNRLLKFMATDGHGKQLETAYINNSLGDLQDNKLIYKLAGLNILSITPATVDMAEQVSFAIDTFQEYYRAKDVIDKLYNDSTLSLYSLNDDKNSLNPDSSEDFETLKLIFEVGSSPLYHRNRHKEINVARQKSIEFSSRLAKDFLNPRKILDNTKVDNVIDQEAVGKTNGMNSRLLTLCRITRNIPFSRNIGMAGGPSDKHHDTKSKDSLNAKDIAELFVLNNLKLFRAKHPEPISHAEYIPERTFLTELFTAAANIGDKNIWDEIISSYWLFTFGILSPYDFKSCNDDEKQKKASDECARRMKMMQELLNELSYNCRDYIYLYDLVHNLHVHYIKRKKSTSCMGITMFMYQNFLCYLPDYAKKHLYHQASETYANNPHDKQLASDINTLLCYIGDSQLLANKFNYNSSGLIRSKELRHILRNFADVTIQKFVLCEKFFLKLQNMDFRSFTIRYFLFRLGLSPIMRDFLFKSHGLRLIPKKELEEIMDMIPFQSIPKEYIEKNYDADICSFLFKQNGAETTGSKLGYIYYGKRKKNHLISIIDIEENSFVGNVCHIGSNEYTIVSDSYINTHKIYCNVKALHGDDKLLPVHGFICTEDNQEKVHYHAASPNTEQRFYLFAEPAVHLYNLCKEGRRLFIGDVECEISFPEQDSQPPLIRENRVLELQSNDTTNSSIPYAGEVTVPGIINNILRPSSSLEIPERFEYLNNDMNIKTEQLRYWIIGQNKSFLWVTTEKIVTPADQLIGNTIIDSKTNDSYLIHSIKHNRTSYLEFWFKVSQNVTLPSYGTFSHLSNTGEYRQIPFCFVVRNNDGFNFKLRVFYEDIEGLPLSDLYDATYLFGNITMRLISIEKIVTNNRYSIWALKKRGVDCLMSEGQFFVPSKQKGSKTSITVSGATRSTIKNIICKMSSYDSASEKLCLIAKRPDGIIGTGTGDPNLLKDLYLSLPNMSSVRLPIEKESALTPLWIKQFNIRFNIKLPMCYGHFHINESKITFLQQKDERFLLWCNTNSGITAEEDLGELLRQAGELTLKFEDGNEGYYQILDISEGYSMEEYSMIIFSHCKPAFAKRIKNLSPSLENGMTEYSLESMVPVYNKPEFPKTIRELYPKHSVRYQRDVKKQGAILIPKPVSVIDADWVLLDNFNRWEIEETKVLNDRYLSVTLRDSEGRIPKIDTHGIVNFVKNDHNQILWYRHVSDLVDRAHPEKYHAEICDILLDEILHGVADLEPGILNFFIQKSRSSDLATNPILLKAIDKSFPDKVFNVCNVLNSDPLKGLEAYSTFHNAKIISSDTMPEGHNGRAFQSHDLVLMERNHRLTLANNLPRYGCLGYKKGFVLSVTDAPNYPNRKKVIIVTNDKEEESYVFFYDKTENARHFFPADDIDFFATNRRSRLTAEDVRFLGTSQPVVEAKFVGRREENKQIIFSFNHKGTVLDVSINEKAVHRNIQYSNLCIGRSYKIIKGSSNYILEK